MFKSIYEIEISVSHGHLVRNVPLQVTFSGVRVSLFLSLLVDPICPVDKWEDCDTNNYRNKPNPVSGSQAVLSMSSLTLSRQYGGPLAEGPHCSNHGSSQGPAGPQTTRPFKPAAGEKNAQDFLGLQEESRKPLQNTTQNQTKEHTLYNFMPKNFWNRQNSPLVTKLRSVVTCTRGVL